MPTVVSRQRVQRLLLDGVDWQAYERLLRIFENRHLRITYDQGTVEIMTLSSEQERFKHLILVLLLALAEELGKVLAGYGSMTLKRRLKKKGLEPDECFFIQNVSRVRGKRKLDLRKDPPPDLAVEIDLTRSSLNRMAIYAALGVPEVWRWTGNQLEVRLLGPQGGYELSETSRAFPGFRPAVIKKFIELEATHDQLLMLRSFRKWVREQIARGWNGKTNGSK
jgi:Uma2 family endonuclease